MSEVRSRGSLRVLIADDNADLLLGTALLLRSRGHQVLTVPDGDLALAEAERFGPDVLVLDINLPGLDGYQVARRVRASGWGETVKLVALTAWSTADDHKRAQAAGFDMHVTKDGDIETLLRVLDDRLR